jgi:cysteine desulfurase/selenocysteine lyase
VNDRVASSTFDEVRALFPGAEGGCYLNSAAESLFMSTHRGALSRYADEKDRGSLGRERCAEVEAACRALVGELISVAPQNVAFLASTARALDVAIKSINWSPGDNIVIADSEFPTTAFAATHLARNGIERRVVFSRRAELHLEDFDDQIDQRTRLVVVSLVSYKTGYRIDVDQLASVVHAKGSLLFIDAIQALGSLPVRAGESDFLSAGTYKWLLGSHGMAVFYVNPNIANQVEVPYVGYRGVVDIFPSDGFSSYEMFDDARRFEEGMANYPAMFVLQNSITYLMSLGIERVGAHNSMLVDQLMAGLDDLAIVPLTTRNHAERGSIVSFETPFAAELAQRLADQGTIVWGRDGVLRISPSLYNNQDDVSRVVDQLAKFATERLLQ